jgi:hypothetical protein
MAHISDRRSTGVDITRDPPKGTAMSPSDTDHFTDMDGNAIEASPEPLPCPFGGSHGDQLVVER